MHPRNIFRLFTDEDAGDGVGYSLCCGLFQNSDCEFYDVRVSAVPALDLMPDEQLLDHENAGTAFCSSIDDPTAHPADEAASAASVGARTASPDSGAADSTDQGAGSGSSTSGAEMESQIDGESGGSDGDAGVASIPLDMPRRSMQLTFTCGKCGVCPSSVA